MRFEVKYDVETKTRKESLAEQDRWEMFKKNKISHLRFKGNEDRGFDILSNDPLNGPGATKINYRNNAFRPISTWTKTMLNGNRCKYYSPFSINIYFRVYVRSLDTDY